MLTYSQLVDAVLNKNQEVIDLMRDKVELLNVIKVLGEVIENQQSVIEEKRCTIEEQNNLIEKQDNVLYKLSLKNKVLTGHVETLKELKELEMDEYTEESDIPLILGTLDGFFECIEQDLKGIDNLILNKVI